MHFYPGIAYPASKTAVNGTQTVAEGAGIIVRMAQTGPDGPTGGYFDASGPVAW